MTVFDARQTLPYWGFLKTYEYSKEHLNFNFNKCRKIISNHDKAKNSKKILLVDFKLDLEPENL